MTVGVTVIAETNVPVSSSGSEGVLSQLVYTMTNDFRKPLCLTLMYINLVLATINASGGRVDCFFNLAIAFGCWVGFEAIRLKEDLSKRE